MAKWFGNIGFAEQEEVRPGVWEEQITDRKYYGDVLRNIRRLESADKLNDDININNELSIISDPYAIQNFHKIRYAEYMGTKWKVTTVEVQRPRLRLSLGGEYNV